MPVCEIRLVQVGTAMQLSISRWVKSGKMDGQSPADHHGVVCTIDLGVPSSETFVETGWDEAGQDTFELRATKERDMTSVREVLEQWGYQCYRWGRSGPR